MADKWTEKTAIEMIKRNKGMVTGKQVSPKGGIKMQGAIDFLVNKHGYRRA